jgi:hypothetical protein
VAAVSRRTLTLVSAETNYPGFRSAPSVVSVVSVARMERSVIREDQPSATTPDFASLHPGYEQPQPTSRHEAPPDEKAPRNPGKSIQHGDPGFRCAPSGLRGPTAARISCHCRCPNSDIKNLESSHRRVSLSHQVLTRSCIAFDPPIDAAASTGVMYRAGPLVEAAPFRVAGFACFAAIRSSRCVDYRDGCRAIFASTPRVRRRSRPAARCGW